MYISVISHHYGSKEDKNIKRNISRKHQRDYELLLMQMQTIKWRKLNFQIQISIYRIQIFAVLFSQVYF